MTNRAPTPPAHAPAPTQAESSAVNAACASVPLRAVDALRLAPHLTVRSLPPLSGVTCVDPAVLCREVEWVAPRHVDALALSSAELRERHAQLRERFGERAPNADQLSALELRVRELDRALARLEALTAVAKQQLTVALSDLSRTVRRTARLVAFEGEFDADFGHGVLPPVVPWAG